jgi:phage tail protein X
MRTRAALVLATVVLATAAFAPLASAQEMQTYTVRAGDTCGNIAQRVYGNSRRYDLIHEHNPDLGAMPHRLQAGTTLRLPVVEVRNSADATVTAVRRSVGSQAPQASEWSRAREGQELDQGWRVNTEEQSSAELTFRSSSVAQVREQTLVIIYGQGVQRVRREGARAVLLEGGLLSRIGSLSGSNEPLEVETASALSTLRTGEASVEVAGGETRVSVHSGEAASVRQVNGTAEVRVEAGTGTRVQQGRPPSRPRPLPRAPRWSDAQATTFLSLGDRGGTIRGQWEPVNNARTYRVEVARRRDGRDAIISQRVPASVRQLELHRLPPGTYYLRIATIDEELFEGRPQAPVELTVVGLDLRHPGAADFTPVVPVDPFDLSTLDAEALPETEHTTDSPVARQLPIGTTIRLPAGVACAIAGASASRELTLNRLGPVQIDCEGSVGDLSVEVVPNDVAAFREDGTTAGAIDEGGQPTPLRIRLAGLRDVSQLTVAAPGIVITETRAIGDGELSLVAQHTGGTGPAMLTISMADGTAVGAVRVPFAALGGPPPPPVIEEEEPELLSVHEAFGLPLYASWVGLTDERRRGSGMHLALSFTSAEEGDVDPTVRVTAGARAAFFHDLLRVDAAVPLDAVGGVERTARRGSRDLFLAVSSLFFDESNIGIAGEVGFFLPTASEQGLDRARMRAAVDASLRVLDEERLILRTRQAGVFDLVENGSLLWASAYGADVWILGPWSAGAEIDLVIGSEEGREAIAAAVGLATHLDFGPIDVSLGGRVGFGDPRLVGLMTVSLAVRGTLDIGGGQ